MTFVLAKAQGSGVGQGAFAAVDLGTNNCRMLIAKAEGRSFRVIDSFSRTTRLGEGLVASGVLSELAMYRTIEGLKRCAEKMARCGVTLGRYVATEACRRARNCHEFIARVREETGIALEIIPPSEEARLALTGCAPLLDRRVPNAVVFDIGGGSTEVMAVRLKGKEQAVVDGFVSLPVGVVTAAEQCGGAVNRDGYERLVDSVRSMLGVFAERHGMLRHIATGNVQMLGSSGTVTTLGAIHLGLSRYERSAVDGLTMTSESVNDIIRTLLAMSLRERLDHPCIGSERSDLVLAGCAILDAICRIWPMRSLRIADRGLREGMLIELMASRADAWRQRAAS